MNVATKSFIDKKGKKQHENWSSDLDYYPCIQSNPVNLNLWFPEKFFRVLKRLDYPYIIKLMRLL